nr:PREDICTED: uncharacterized protein LOC109035513 [Bemisia tabaci]
MVLDSLCDPWNAQDGESQSVSESSTSKEPQEFEDNFHVNSNRLPDSDEYIAALEKKLSKLKSSKQSSSGDSGTKELLASLQEFRESCMVRLISGSNSALISNTDLDLDSSLPKLPSQWLRNQINPETPLTVGEALELLKADYLELNHIETTQQEISEPEN